MTGFWRTALAAALCLTLYAQGSDAKAQANAVMLPPEAVRSDFDALYVQLEQAHYDLFAHRPRGDYDRFHAQLRSEIDEPMNSAAAALLFQRFVAYGRVGHARIDAPVQAFVADLAGGSRLLPLFIRVDEGRVVLTATADADGRFPAGSEILEINEHPAADWLDRLEAYVSAERPYMAHALMEQSFPVLLGFELGNIDGVDVRAITPTGQAVEGRIDAVTLAGRRAIAAAWPTPSPPREEPREFNMLPDGVGYLRPGPFHNLAAPAEGPQPSYSPVEFTDFIDGAFARLLEANATDLIIDLRDNPGGDNSFSDLMVAWFADRPFRFASRFSLKASAQTKAWYAKSAATEAPDAGLAALLAAEAAQPDGARYDYPLPLNPPRSEPRFHGRVHVLVNRHSYSNAASVAALIQDYGFGHVLGEETADVPTTYASVLYFDLPETGITVTYPKSRIVRPNGDERLSGVVPDHALPRPPIGVKQDVMLDQAVALVRSGRTAPGP